MTSLVPNETRVSPHSEGSLFPHVVPPLLLPTSSRPGQPEAGTFLLIPCSPAKYVILLPHPHHSPRPPRPGAHTLPRSLPHPQLSLFQSPHYLPPLKSRILVPSLMCVSAYPTIHGGPRPGSGPSPSHPHPVLLRSCETRPLRPRLTQMRSRP